MTFLHFCRWEDAALVFACARQQSLKIRNLISSSQLFKLQLQDKTKLFYLIFSRASFLSTSPSPNVNFWVFPLLSFTSVVKGCSLKDTQKKPNQNETKRPTHHWPTKTNPKPQQRDSSFLAKRSSELKAHLSIGAFLPPSLFMAQKSLQSFQIKWYFEVKEWTGQRTCS